MVCRHAACMSSSARSLALSQTRDNRNVDSSSTSARREDGPRSPWRSAALSRPPCGASRPRSSGCGTAVSARLSASAAYLRLSREQLVTATLDDMSSTPTQHAVDASAPAISGAVPGDLNSWLRWMQERRHRAGEARPPSLIGCRRCHKPREPPAKMLLCSSCRIAVYCSARAK
jgi:hypothetical protein